MKNLKYALFCIACLMLLNIISVNADKQMKQDLHKMQQQSYTM